MTRRRKKQLKIERDLILESEAESRQRMCGSKKQYNSALESLAWGRKANEDYNQEVVWDTYFCTHCSKWHLTSIK